MNWTEEEVKKAIELVFGYCNENPLNSQMPNNQKEFSKWVIRLKNESK